MWRTTEYFKKTIKIFKNKWFLGLIAILLIASVAMYCKNFFIVKKEHDFVSDLNAKINNLISINNNLSLEIKSLNNSLLELENKLNSYENSILTLEDRVLKIENANPINNERNIQIVILINKIKDSYYNNVNFAKEFNSLKILAKNKVDVYDNILRLENFLNVDTSFKNFKNEYKKLLTSPKNTGIKKFIADNIQIRKLNNSDDSSPQIDKNLEAIESLIKTHKYEEALKIIKDNNYNMPNTEKTLINNIDFDNIINLVLNSIYKNY